MRPAGAIVGAAALLSVIGTAAALAQTPPEYRLLLGGRDVAVQAPRGNCPLDPANANEAALIDAMATLQSTRNKLVLRFVDCAELQQFRDGHRESFSRHGMVLAVLQDGVIKPVTDATRRQFLDNVAKSLPTLDTDRLLAEVRNRLATAGSADTVAEMQPLGVLDRNDDGLFVGFVVRGVNPGAVPTVAVMALTLINHIPITLYLYQPFDKPADLKPFVATQRANLRDLLAMNAATDEDSSIFDGIDWSEVGVAAAIGGSLSLVVAFFMLRRRYAAGDGPRGFGLLGMLGGVRLPRLWPRRRVRRRRHHGRARF